MNAKHTPGPWQVNRKGQTHVEAARDGQGINIIANCDDPDDIRTRDEDRANAKLIAAAPELLAACEAAVFGANHIDCVRAMQEVLPQIRAAIAKATA